MSPTGEGASRDTDAHAHLTSETIAHRQYTLLTADRSTSSFPLQAGRATNTYGGKSTDDSLFSTFLLSGAPTTTT